jgi:RNA ligase (TIGR02306 family)
MEDTMIEAGERQLSSVRRIREITPIEGADNIELAHVDGWQVVVKKGEFQKGDYAVYFEIDSWIPTELAPFLSKGKEPREFNGVKGERLKTIKLRGEISQGLLLPTSILPVGQQTTQTLDSLLNVQKWEKPIPAQLAGLIKGNFPSFLKKTDQERIQNIFYALTERDKQSYWEISEKLDGSSMTVYLNDNVFGVCSRNIDLKEDLDNTFWKVAYEEDLRNKLEVITGYLGYPVALQGELIGPGIQGNYYDLSKHQFRLFNIWDIEERKYMLPDDVGEICDMFSIPMVPVLSTRAYLPGIKEKEEDLLRGILGLAEGKSEINPTKEREGLVFKRSDATNSFKAISNKWLLKNE